MMFAELKGEPNLSPSSDLLSLRIIPVLSEATNFTM